MQAVINTKDPIIGIDWKDLPDKKQQFVPHDLSEGQKQQINNIKDKFPNVFQENVSYGKAKVEPFDLKLVEGGQKYLQDHNRKLSQLEVKCITTSG